MQVATTTEDEVPPMGSGSNVISATPRRGRESVDTLSYVIRIATTGQLHKMFFCHWRFTMCQIRPHAGVSASTTISLLWRNAETTSDIVFDTMHHTREIASGDDD